MFTACPEDRHPVTSVPSGRLPAFPVIVPMVQVSCAGRFGSWPVSTTECGNGQRAFPVVQRQDPGFSVAADLLRLSWNVHPQGNFAGLIYQSFPPLTGPGD